jgi:hypothetical protein
MFKSIPVKKVKHIKDRHLIRMRKVKLIISAVEPRLASKAVYLYCQASVI